MHGGTRINKKTLVRIDGWGRCYFPFHPWFEERSFVLQVRSANSIQLLGPLPSCFSCTTICPPRVVWISVRKRRRVWFVMMFRDFRLMVAAFVARFQHLGSYLIHVPFDHVPQACVAWRFVLLHSILIVRKTNVSFNCSESLSFFCLYKHSSVPSLEVSPIFKRTSSHFVSDP